MLGEPMTHYVPFAAILDSLLDEIVFVDTDHVIRYMNPAAIQHYDEGEALLGTSIFDCHNHESNEVIREVSADMWTGLDERKITDNDKKRIFMRAVRDPAGEFIGYYERYEHKRTDRA
jgi:DUF438 domain-containing protein